MSFWAILVIAVGVSIDAFAVSVSGALCADHEHRYRNAFRAALYFGGFQILMPVAGYFVAAGLHSFVEHVDHWLAALLLAFVGGKMIVEGWKAGGGPDPECRPDFFGWRALWVPAVATSLDALAVGASLAFAGSAILIPSLAMGGMTALISATGVLVGNRLGKFFGERPLLIAGGAAIILIGLKILYDHLTA